MVHVIDASSSIFNMLYSVVIYSVCGFYLFVASMCGNIMWPNGILMFDWKLNLEQNGEYYALCSPTHPISSTVKHSLDVI